MLFTSLYFWFFLLVVLLVYYILPQKVKCWWLLFSGYVFCALHNIKALLVLIIVTIITYCIARVISQESKFRHKKLGLVVGVGSVIFILCMFKYLNFLLDNLNKVLSILGRPSDISYIDMLMPVGISFYSFRAISYVLDVAWKKHKVVTNFGEYALYLSFFPQLTAGPIVRTEDFFESFARIKTVQEVDWESAILHIGYGLFEKMVIADRLSILVDTVYNNYQNYAGWQLIFASVCFSIQILCDFDGYSNIAIGVSKTLGYEVKKNFDLPYFSLSIKEFWRRWHISLSTWFKDYLYIPLGGNRKGTLRKYLNLFIVFLVSGLWHGAGWNYVIWGGIHGIYQIIGDILKPVKKKILVVLKVQDNVASYKFLQGFTTFMLVNFAWIFFKLQDISVIRAVIGKMIKLENLGSLLQQDIFYSMGLDKKEFGLAIIAMGVFIIVSIMQKYIKDLLQRFKNQNLYFKWIIYYALIFGVIIFGVYGGDYSAGNFIYVSF